MRACVNYTRSYFLTTCETCSLLTSLSAEDDGSAPGVSVDLKATIYVKIQYLSNYHEVTYEQSDRNIEMIRMRQRA